MKKDPPHPPGPPQSSQPPQGSQPPHQRPPRLTPHPSKPEDVFRAEKERAQGSRNSQHARLLAEAKAAFDKLMAEGQAARKSGRPRKHPLPPLKTSSSRTPPKPPQVAPAAKPPASTPAPVAIAPARSPAKPVTASSKTAVPKKPAAKTATKTKPKGKTTKSSRR